NTGLAIGSYTINNQGSVTSTEVTTPVTSNTVSNTLLVQPQLSISKSESSNSALDANLQVEPGNTITYTVVVTNTGSSPVTTVHVTDSIPADATYVAASATCA